MSYEDEAYKKKLEEGYKNPYERILHIEESMLRLSHLGGLGNRTVRDIQEELHSSTCRNFGEKFNRYPIGVHGVELPSMKNLKTNWWEKKKGYAQNPMYQSQITMKEDKKFWKPNEKQKLKDNSLEDLGPEDPFKRTSPVFLNRDKISYIESKLSGKIGEEA